LDSLASIQHLVTGASDFWLNGSVFVSCFSLEIKFLTNRYHVESTPTDASQPNHELLTFDVLNSFKFWDAVPLNGSASYAQIAESTNLPESIVRRFLRYAFTSFVFTEAPLGSGNVVHTPASAYIARSPFMQAFLAHNLEDIRPATTVGVDALKKWFVGRVEPPEELTTCAMSLATDGGVQRDTDLWTFFNNFERDDQPKGFRAKRFAEAMQGIAQNMGNLPEAVLKLFDWEGLNDATVVDVSQRTNMLDHRNRNEDNMLIWPSWEVPLDISVSFLPITTPSLILWFKTSQLSSPPSTRILDPPSMHHVFNSRSMTFSMPRTSQQMSSW
jgi:hypothetical protein